MSKSTLKWTVVGSTLLLAIGWLHVLEPDLHAGGGDSRRGFDVGSLYGSYASVGRADGIKSMSVGVAEFDGRGGVTRFVRINADDGHGGRRLIDLTSVGTYTVERDGLGVIEFTNTGLDGSTTDVSFDFVICTSNGRGERRGPLAQTFEAVQQQRGFTASLVEASFTRQVGRH